MFLGTEGHLTSKLVVVQLVTSEHLAKLVLVDITEIPATELLAFLALAILVRVTTTKKIVRSIGLDTSSVIA